MNPTDKEPKISIRDLSELMRWGKKPNFKPATQAHPYVKGSLIGQKYEVLDILGKGGFGIVYRVHSRETHEEYALKTFRDEFLANAEARKLFRREADVWVALDHHENIVQAHLVDEVAGRLYIAMEYIAPDAQGRNTLQDHLGKELSETQSLKWAIQFCHGMEYAYSKGIRCHRDIKPANIMITQDKTLKISDFGLASVLGVPNPNADAKLSIQQGKVGLSGSILQGKGFGTPAYMPPEQFTNDASCDQRSDIYSFGIVLYQMLSGGELPFKVEPKNNSPEEIARYCSEMYRLHCNAPVPTLKSTLAPYIQHCLAKNPSKRYQTFQELRKDLKMILKWLSEEIEKTPEPKEPEAIELANKGGSYNTLRRYEQAILYCDKALEINPFLVVALNNKGTALNSLRRFGEALECFDRALKIDPTDAELWNNKAFSYSGLGRYNEALKCTEKSLSSNPRFPQAWLNKGTCLLYLSHMDEALKCFEKALEIDGQLADAWFNKGVCLKQMKRLEEALACYDEALRIDPQHVESLFNKGKILLESGRLGEAVMCFDKFLKINPQAANAWISLGICHNRMCNYDEALRCYNAALEVDPHSALAWYNKGYTLGLTSRFAEAAECYSKSVKYDPTHVESWFGLAAAQATNGQMREAAETLRTFIKIASPENVIEVQLARALLLGLNDNGSNPLSGRSNGNSPGYCV